MSDRPTAGPPPKSRRDRCVPDWLAAQARAMPGAPALIAGSVQWTFEQLDRRADRTARQLASLGVDRGTRVALLSWGGPWFVVTVHALTRLGAVTIPLNPRLADAELAWQLADAGAAVLLLDGALAPRSAQAVLNRPGVRVAVGDSAEPAGGGSAVPVLSSVRDADVSLRREIDLEDVQGVIYTSATSGRPKGVLLTYGNYWWSAIGSMLRLGHRRDDRWLAPLPLWHVGGLALVWRTVIYGIPLVLHDAFDADAVNGEIDAGNVSLVSMVSAMLERVLAARGNRPFPPSLRCVLLGGGPAPRGLLETCARSGVPVAPTYGLTETASQVATLGPDEVTGTPGAVGPPLLPTRLRIDIDGRWAAPGEMGEIVVAGPTVMRGYLGRDDETARALRDGWLRTGDLGYLDDRGYLYVLDRRDDLIITGGENVYPAEVEAALCAHPGVADAGVVGLPDPRWGQAVAAIVVQRPSISLRADDVRAFLEPRLARYKQPRYVWFVDAVPRSAGGKLLRREIRTWAEAQRPRDTGDLGGAAGAPQDSDRCV